MNEQANKSASYPNTSNFMAEITSLYEKGLRKCLPLLDVEVLKHQTL